MVKNRVAVAYGVQKDTRGLGSNTIELQQCFSRQLWIESAQLKFIHGPAREVARESLQEPRSVTDLESPQLVFGDVGEVFGSPDREKNLRVKGQLRTECFQQRLHHVDSPPHGGVLKEN